MEVILLEDVKNLGKRGDKVKVADGYGRNFLIPRGLVLKQLRAIFGPSASTQSRQRP